MFDLTDGAGEVFGRVIYSKPPVFEKLAPLPADDTVLVFVSSVSYMLPFGICIMGIS